MGPRGSKTPITRTSMGTAKYRAPCGQILEKLAGAEPVRGQTAVVDARGSTGSDGSASRVRGRDEAASGDQVLARAGQRACGSAAT